MGHNSRRLAVLDLARVVIGGLAVLLGLAGYAKVRRPGPSSIMLARRRGSRRHAGGPRRRRRRARRARRRPGPAGARRRGSWWRWRSPASPSARRWARAAPAGRRAAASATRARRSGPATSPPTSPPRSPPPVRRPWRPTGLARLASQRPGLALVDLGLAAMLAVALRRWLRGAGGAAGTPRRWRSSTPRRACSRRGVSRRSALTRIAVAGSALAVAPVRYLLYPGTALGVVVPGRCRDGLCTDGYTAFCCEIHQGLNTCPVGTFVGGWWMCTDYRGHQLCQGSGVRYYVDCNNLPGRPFPGGCRCANDDCSHRRQACNVFRYGQCNTTSAGRPPSCAAW